MWSAIKYSNIHVMGVPEGKDREKRTEKYSNEIMTENFPKSDEKH